jgi:branched-chain amino acid transport system ATP-binding protein
MIDILRLDNLKHNFGGLMAVDGVSLRVAPGERRALIGPNGAGKTTLFNVVSGELPATTGTIYLDGQDITRRAAHERAKLGMGRTFQRNNLFFGLSVFENVRLAVQRRQGISGHFFAPAARYEPANAAALEILERFGLQSYREAPVSALAYGQQRSLEIALAIANAPRLLLLDEPTAGMSPAETAEIVRLIDGLPDDLTIMIIEHDMDVIFSLADRITVLYYGRVLVEGTPDEVKGNRQAQEIYFGEGAGPLLGQ